MLNTVQFGFGGSHIISVPSTIAVVVSHSNHGDTGRQVVLVHYVARTCINKYYCLLIVAKRLSSVYSVVSGAGVWS